MVMGVDDAAVAAGTAYAAGSTAAATAAQIAAAQLAAQQAAQQAALQGAAGQTFGTAAASGPSTSAVAPGTAGGVAQSAGINPSWLGATETAPSAAPTLSQRMAPWMKGMNYAKQANDVLWGERKVGAAPPARPPVQGVPRMQGPDPLAAYRQQEQRAKQQPGLLDRAIGAYGQSQGGGPQIPTTSQPESIRGGESMTMGDRFNGFMGNVDANMQSPSKALGLGLGARIHPGIGLLGMGLAGMRGPNRVY